MDTRPGTAGEHSGSGRGGRSLAAASDPGQMGPGQQGHLRSPFLGWLLPFGRVCGPRGAAEAWPCDSQPMSGPCRVTTLLSPAPTAPAVTRQTLLPLLARECRGLGSSGRRAGRSSGRQCRQAGRAGREWAQEGRSLCWMPVLAPWQGPGALESEGRFIFFQKFWALPTPTGT